jgi:hypothetical protein
MLDVQPGFEKFPASEIYTLVEDPVGSVDKTPVLSFDLEQWLLSKSASSVAPMIEMVEKTAKSDSNFGMRRFQGRQGHWDVQFEGKPRSAMGKRQGQVQRAERGIRRRAHRNSNSVIQKQNQASDREQRLRFD